ncbi:hypothetical protein AA0X95_14350 [Bacillus sp. 1P10SD]|uniref:hypothetical protein n=1 Tax=Bacillus sp. 1P10SD TaxID=3132265 RepID=UPI0039A4D514
MITNQMIQGLITSENIKKASIQPIKPGQLLYGRVEKFLPNEKALIQIGNGRVIAQLQTTLLSEEYYWFEVSSATNEGIQLKIVEVKGQNGSANNFLELMNLPKTKLNEQLWQFFLSKNLPFTTEQFRLASSFISHPLMTKECTALEWMLKREFPFTKLTFQSLVAVQDSQPFSMQLEQLGKYLDHPKFAELKSIGSLKQLITTILSKQTSYELENGSEVKQLLQSLVHSMGLDYELEVGLWAKNKKPHLEVTPTLKSVVLRVISELGSDVQELEFIINRLTGMQLLSQDVTNAMQPILMQLPISLEGKRSDITLQWNGRKTRSGEIDPDYCQILFYLELKTLKETVIEMQIQNKVVHVSVLNDSYNIQPIIEVMTPFLKEKLTSLGYHLSYIKLNPTSGISSQLSTESLMGKYQRLDIKI